MRNKFGQWLWIGSLSILFVVRETNAQEKGRYAQLNEMSWSDVLKESNQYKWEPPHSINLLLHPYHSKDWIYLNPSMAVSRRSVPLNISSVNHEQRKAAEGQEDLVVQFAFDDPPFLPDFNLTDLRLEGNKYPVTTADYFSNDLYYKIQYVATKLDNEQTLLGMKVSVSNESEQEKEVTVRTKVGYYTENQIFDYHYIPFYWNASKWKAYKGITLKGREIFKANKQIGTISSDNMDIAWETKKLYTDKQFEDMLYPQVWWGSGYVLPEFRVKEIQDVIRATRKIQPNDSAHFSIKLLIRDKNITSSHVTTLNEVSFDQMKQQALKDFKRPFTADGTSMEFKTAEWEDIFTSLQVNILQLLVNDIQRDVYQPSQGGSSERFFVWVWEAVTMLRPMLRTGQFTPVKKALDYIFSLQDAGFPPKGRFTTTKGSIGTTGPRWANTTGMALTLVCDYYLYSKDRAFIDQYQDKILKAMHWISGEVKATRKINPDGTRPLTYGLMPYAVASDGDEGYFVGSTDVFTYWGFSKAVQLLEAIRHPEAAEMRKELDQYKADILIAIGHLARADGFIDRKVVIGNDANHEAVKFANTDIVAPIATVGIMDPRSDIFQKYIQYYENKISIDYFTGPMDRDISYMILDEHYWQPIYLTLGEGKKAFMTLQTCLKYAMSQDAHLTQERFDKRNPNFAPWQPNGSGSGQVVDMILNALYFEGEKEVSLLGCVPFDYLYKNQLTTIKNLYTLTGKVNLSVKVVDKNTCRVELSSDQPLPAKIRIPEYFAPKPVGSAVKAVGKGLFEVKKQTKQIAFQIHRKD